MRLLLILGVQKKQDKISFLDVGQGDCIALSLNRQDMILVDGLKFLQTRCGTVYHST